MSRDSIRIALLLAALNDVNLLSTDIGNAYLNASPREKGVSRKKCSNCESPLWPKSSGAAWRAHLANTLHLLGFSSCLADPDVWFRPATKPCGFQYYEYVLVYVDDLLVLSHQGELIMKSLEDFY